MTSQNIGPTFYQELKDAGLIGLPFAWGADGTFSFNESMSQENIDSVLDVYERHDPALAADAT
ncbi:hypothetical protein HU723_10815 [Pseudomonas lurida]|uniref:hypothetical protein n=1 Tax=Pseudomonas lurida TaxID=244566 RepID=UPI0016477DC2|nr:hypothetical protein [Pseudomonas lurida]MBC3239671.1 hypothetical protein [Pseudomonas lurida]